MRSGKQLLETLQEDWSYQTLSKILGLEDLLQNPQITSNGSDI